jgi:hypothetical protein
MTSLVTLHWTVSIIKHWSIQNIFDTNDSKVRQVNIFLVQGNWGQHFLCWRLHTHQSEYKIISAIYRLDIIRCMECCCFYEYMFCKLCDIENTPVTSSAFCKLKTEVILSLRCLSPSRCFHYQIRMYIFGVCMPLQRLPQCI